MAETNRAVRRAATARWARRRSASAAAALAGAVLGGALYLGNRAYITATSPARCGAGCVTDGSVPLDSGSGMLDVEADIAKANRSATSGGSYVSVVLLDPFTYSPSGTVSLQRMTDELRGAYLAQQAANAGNGTPRIRLLLANEGTSGEEGEAQAVRRIESLEGPDHIVAVAGMGLSTVPTQTAATALAADGMPMFGAVTTGDQFYGVSYQGFYQIVPNVDAQVQRLWTDLKGAKGRSVALISSALGTDIYSTDLQTDFKAAVGSVKELPDYPFNPDAPSKSFSDAATTICRQPGISQIVLYAGREAELPALVQQFQVSAVCGGKNVAIVTGSDANALRASVTIPQQGNPGAAVSVEYSDIEDVSNLSSGFKTGYQRWLPSDVSPRVDCLNQLYDPWAVATYNSVMAAVGAVRHSPGSPDKETVLSSAVALQGAARYPGAASQFGFNANGQLAPADIPVYRESNGTCALVSAGG
jgi:hypothetical protein